MNILEETCWPCYNRTTAPFHKQISHRNSNSMENWFYCNFTVGNHITTKFCKCDDSTDENFIAITYPQFSWEQNEISITMEKSIHEMGPRMLAANVWLKWTFLRKNKRMNRNPVDNLETYLLSEDVPFIQLEISRWVQITDLDKHLWVPN